MTEFIRKIYAQNGGPRGSRLGYATADIVYTRDGGWLQTFERGAITDSRSSSTQVVWGPRWTVWKANGREDGALGYPVGPYTTSVDGGWIQLFQTGAITDSASTPMLVVSGASHWKWSLLARERGVLGYPVAAQETATGGWIQRFQNGAICGGPVRTEAVPNPMYPAWVAAGREGGVLGYPTGPHHTVSRGTAQFFQGGELWALAGATPRRVYGDVLTQWKAEGGSTGRYGFPVTDTTAMGNQLTCTFEGGTITA
jgi:uncharacterized protein with LGFP repeats